MSALLDRAIHFAVTAHTTQTDKVGQPYILHPLRVMIRIAEQFPEDEVIQAAAVLHDVVEDCGISLDWLAHDIHPEVAEIVDSVSRRVAHDEGSAASALLQVSVVKEIYRDFIHRAKAHPKGRFVKIADIEDNLLPWRCEGLDPEDRDFLTTRHTRALEWLK